MEDRNGHVSTGPGHVDHRRQRPPTRAHGPGAVDPGSHRETRVKPGFRVVKW